MSAFIVRSQLIIYLASVGLHMQKPVLHCLPAMPGLTVIFLALLTLGICLDNNVIACSYLAFEALDICLDDDGICWSCVQYVLNSHRVPWRSNILNIGQSVNYNLYVRV